MKKPAMQTCQQVKTKKKKRHQQASLTKGPGKKVP